MRHWILHRGFKKSLILNNVIDLSMSNIEREKSAGSFSVDLVGEDSQGNLVIRDC